MHKIEMRDLFLYIVNLNIRKIRPSNQRFLNLSDYRDLWLSDNQTEFVSRQNFAKSENKC